MADISKITQAMSKTVDKPDWISETLIRLVQFRINQEEFSSRIYLAMSVWLNLNGYFGASKLYKKYSDEEEGHAQAFREYLLDLNVLPEISVVAKPQTAFTSLMDVAQKTLEHELLVTKQINSLASESLKASDFMALEIAQRYLREQTEEISKSRGLIDRLEIAGDDKCSLLIIDKELGEKA